MHKLVILIEPLQDYDAFEESWPQFLHTAESMPGLRRESTSRVDGVLYGRYHCTIIHELYFDSLADIQEAMRSPEYADHKEDDLENILKFRKQEADDSAEDTGAD
ncbi:MAG: EthD family reductase [Anaerolineales bacterium]